MAQDDPPAGRPARPRFPSAALEAEFAAAYDAVLQQWPVPVDSLDVPTGYGRTHVQVAGPVDAPPVVLLHSGGATSTVWFANVADLARDHRVYAVDQLGDLGRSVHDGRPMYAKADLMAWLDAVFDGLGLRRAALAGHSYGAWLALNYAVHAPARLDKLVLLDPTGCVAGMRLRYRVHAVPLFARPSAPAMRRFLAWETDGADLDRAWLRLSSLAGELRSHPKLILPKRPRSRDMRACAVPTLVLLAENSKSLDVRRAAANARRLLPDVRVLVLPGATHHTIPTLGAAQLNREILQFLT